MYLCEEIETNSEHHLYKNYFSFGTAQTLLEL